MKTSYQICIEDALEHSTQIDEFDTYEEAKKCYDECMKKGPEGYDISIEMEKIIGDYEDFETIEYHEWFTQEEWEAAHPSGYPD